jgi:hypothetical protein
MGSRDSTDSAGDDRLRLVVGELMRLRQGPSLTRPSAVRQLSAAFRQLILAGAEPVDTADEIERVVATLRAALDSLDEHQRRYARVDFNLDERHAYPTLTERQASLAAELGCASKTVRRYSDRALETLALTLVIGTRPPPAPSPPGPQVSAWHDGTETSWQATLRTFLGLPPRARVDIVCSEIPPEQRPAFAEPQHRFYLRYAKFADLDSLIHVRTQLAQTFPDLSIRDFSPSVYFDTSADALFVLGGPGWNAKFREFQAQLPFYFEPHPPGEDDPLVVPLLGEQRFGPSWAPGAQLASDVSVFVRLTLASGTRIFLVAGCLTLGVLGAAKCFLQAKHGVSNAEVITALAGQRDFVLVTEATRIGGITDVADLATAGPLVLLVRGETGRFELAVDNSKRHRYPAPLA